MIVLVIDVAAEHSGAETILNQFLDEFEADPENEYYVVLSKLHYQDRRNIRFINTDWVKRSHAHRLYFDWFYARKLVREIKPDKVLSLQNKTVRAGNVTQEVYFQNALPICEKRFSIKESRNLWVYQNILGNMVRYSLKRADVIYVQARWIREALNRKWNIAQDKIRVKRPSFAQMPASDKNCTAERDEKQLFYPANGSIYKNHEMLLKACAEIWDRKGADCGLRLTLTCDKNRLTKNCRDILEGKDYPVCFCGRLNREEMAMMYSRTSLVFPSYVETIGLPLMEAQAYDAKILAADCEYAREVLEGYKKAVYLNPFDTDSMAKGICRAIGLED